MNNFKTNELDNILNSSSHLIELWIPSWALIAIKNNNENDLNNEDISNLNKWKSKYELVDYDKETADYPEFKLHNSLSIYGDNCVKVYVKRKNTIGLTSSINIDTDNPLKAINDLTAETCDFIYNAKKELYKSEKNIKLIADLANKLDDPSEVLFEVENKLDDFADNNDDLLDGLINDQIKYLKNILNK